MIKKIAIPTAALFLLSGCSAINQFFNGEQQSAPVKNIPMQQTYYTVRAGDSLYDLSRRFNVTERTLILWNQLKSPFELIPGVTIRVGPLPGEKILRDGQVYTYQGGVMVPAGSGIHTKDTASLAAGSRVSAVSETVNNMPVIDPNAAPKNQSVFQAQTSASVQDRERDMHDLAQTNDNVTMTQTRIKKSTTGFYTVQSGDSLLEIAVANEVSLSELQTWNDIKEPSMIYVGEKLKVINPIKDKVSSEPRAQDSGAAKEASAKTNNLAKGSPQEIKPVNITKAGEKPKATSIASTELTVQKTKMPEAKNSTPSGKTVAGILWQWPLKEAGKFDKNGIDQQREIEVPQGTKVYAAASGNVLYASVGMGGYGEMVIINHQNGYISAYNNLKNISVKESQEVTQGQLLGEVGKFNGTSTLGFEIRQSGNVQKLSDFYTF